MRMAHGIAATMHATYVDVALQARHGSRQLLAARLGVGQLRVQPRHLHPAHAHAHAGMQHIT